MPATSMYADQAQTVGDEGDDKENRHRKRGCTAAGPGSVQAAGDSTQNT